MRDSNGVTPEVRAYVHEQMLSVFNMVADQADWAAREYESMGKREGAESLRVFAASIRANNKRWASQIGN